MQRDGNATRARLGCNVTTDRLIANVATPVYDATPECASPRLGMQRDGNATRARLACNVMTDRLIAPHSNPDSPEASDEIKKDLKHF
jgi:hypothetical protein